MGLRLAVVASMLGGGTGRLALIVADGPDPVAAFASRACLSLALLLPVSLLFLVIRESASGCVCNCGGSYHGVLTTLLIAGGAGLDNRTRAVFDRCVHSPILFWGRRCTRRSYCRSDLNLMGKGTNCRGIHGGVGTIDRRMDPTPS